MSEVKDIEGQREARPVYMISGANDEDGIDLLELAFALWRHKWIVVSMTALFALLGTTYALLATPIYRAEIVLMPVESDARPDLSSSLGGLASMAGLNIGTSGNGEEAIATLRSRAFIEGFIMDNELLPVLFSDRWNVETGKWFPNEAEEPPDIRDGVEYFVNNVRSISEDPNTSLITLSIEWRDPEAAAKWAEQLVMRVNSRLRERDLVDAQRRLEYLNAQMGNANVVELRQVIAQLIQEQMQTLMLAEAEPEYAFKVIDPSRVPDQSVSPKRTLIVLLGSIFGGALGSLAAIVNHIVGRRYSAAN